MNRRKRAPTVIFDLNERVLTLQTIYRTYIHSISWRIQSYNRLEHAYNEQITISEGEMVQTL